MWKIFTTIRDWLFPAKKHHTEKFGIKVNNRIVVSSKFKKKS